MINVLYTKPSGTEIKLKDLPIGQGFRLGPIYASKGPLLPHVEEYYVKLNDVCATLIIQVNTNTKQVIFGSTHNWADMYVIPADVELDIIINGDSL